MTSKTAAKFSEFIQTIAALRDPQTGCPWDLEQDHLTLRAFMLEEAYEAVEAMGGPSKEHICEELGDVLLQVVLNAQISKDEGGFEIYDVVDSINAKMIHRHPHVFSSTELNTTEEVLDNWDKLKGEESGSDPFLKKIKKLKKVNPALTQAAKIGRFAQKANFDWTELPQVLSKVEEEIAELRSAVHSGEQKQIEDELGDVFFSLSQLSRHLGLDPEAMAQKGNHKFLARFQKIKDDSDLDYKSFCELDVHEKEKLWQQAKASR